MVGPAGLEPATKGLRSEEHTSELQSRGHLVCRLLLEKKKLEPDGTILFLVHAHGRRTDVHPITSRRSTGYSVGAIIFAVVRSAGTALCACYGDEYLLT